MTHAMFTVARKGEGTPDRLERRRREHLEPTPREAPTAAIARRITGKVSESIERPEGHP